MTTEHIIQASGPLLDRASRTSSEPVLSSWCRMCQCVPGHLTRRFISLVLGLWVWLIAGPVAAQAATQPDCSSIPGNLVGDCGFEQPVVDSSGFFNANANTLF
jgi:hypothetical protein